MQLSGEAQFPTITGCLCNCAFSASYKEKKIQRRFGFLSSFHSAQQSTIKPGVWSPLSSHQKLAPMLKAWTWAKKQAIETTYNPPGSLEKLITQSNFQLTLMQFQSRPFLHFNTSMSTWTLRFGRAWWKEADLFKADYNFCFNLETRVACTSCGFWSGCYIYLNPLHLRKL